MLVWNGLELVSPWPVLFHWVVGCDLLLTPWALQAGGVCGPGAVKKWVGPGGEWVWSGQKTDQL